VLDRLSKIGRYDILTWSRCIKLSEREWQGCESYLGEDDVWWHIWSFPNDHLVCRAYHFERIVL
jgi:hypothetical protein